MLDQIKNLSVSGNTEKVRIRVLDYVGRLTKEDIPLSVFSEIKQTIKGIRRKAPAGCDPQTYSRIYEALVSVAGAIDREKPLLEYDPQIEEKLIEQKAHFLRAAMRFWELFDRCKAERSLLDYEDLQLKTKKLMLFLSPRSCRPIHIPSPSAAPLRLPPCCLPPAVVAGAAQPQDCLT